MSRATLDLGKRLHLVEAKADAQSFGVGPESGETDNPLDAVDVNQIRGGTVAQHRFFLANKLSVIGITGKVCAVAIGDGQRISRRNIHLCNVVCQPIKAKRCDNNAAYSTVISIEGQRKMNELPVN